MHASDHDPVGCRHIETSHAGLNCRLLINIEGDAPLGVGKL